MKRRNEGKYAKSGNAPAGAASPPTKREFSAYSAEDFDFDRELREAARRMKESRRDWIPSHWRRMSVVCTCNQVMDFYVVREGHGFVTLYKHQPEGVTCHIHTAPANVVRAILDRYGFVRIFCYGKHGSFDELVHDGKVFRDYSPAFTYEAECGDRFAAERAGFDVRKFWNEGERVGQGE